MYVSSEEAVLQLRGDPAHAALVRDAYLGPDRAEACGRFLASGEFQEVRQLLAGRLEGCRILDLGAGTGIASYAFARSGVRTAVALEPDQGTVCGTGALLPLIGDLPIRIVHGFGEEIPFRNEWFDVVYARQVLHHAVNLKKVLRECARVLKTGGVFLACREHVVDNDAQLEEFRANHPVHHLVGNESAYPVDTYREAIQSSGLSDIQTWGPWDSVINAFPAVNSTAELRDYPRRRLREKLGGLGALAAHLPGVLTLFRRCRMDRAVPGRLYSFLGVKPGPRGGIAD